MKRVEDMIGWMGFRDADYDNDATVAYDWIHALTMPRELEWKDGKILQHPLKEMKDLRKMHLPASWKHLQSGRLRTAVLN